MGFRLPWWVSTTNVGCVYSIVVFHGCYIHIVLFIVGDGRWQIKSVIVMVGLPLERPCWMIVLRVLTTCVQMCRHVLAVNGGGRLVKHGCSDPPTPMACGETSAFDAHELNYRYWPAYQDGKLDDLMLPVQPGPVTRCKLTYAHAEVMPSATTPRDYPLRGARAADAGSVHSDNSGGSGGGGGRDGAVGGGGDGGDGGGGGSGADDGGFGPDQAGDGNGSDDDNGRPTDSFFEGIDDLDDDGAGADSDRDALGAVVRRVSTELCGNLLSIVGLPAAFRRVQGEAAPVAQIAADSVAGAARVRQWLALFRDVPPPEDGSHFSQWKHAIEDACVRTLAALARVRTAVGLCISADGLCAELALLRADLSRTTRPDSRKLPRHSKNCGLNFRR